MLFSFFTQLIFTDMTLMTRHKGRMEEDGFKLSGERDLPEGAALDGPVVVNQAQNADFLTT